MTGNKILVVEDDQNLLATLKYSLQKEGYGVTTAADGAEAIDTARRGKPDLVILDLMLPKMSGFEVCRILRKDMTVPILMLTAKTKEVDKIVGLEIGADDYMTKPFSMGELLTFIIEDPRTITRATRLIWVAHNLERSADRVTNICERVVYLVTGKMEEIGASRY